jgi:hypothetical protein
MLLRIKLHGSWHALKDLTAAKSLKLKRKREIRIQQKKKSLL